MALAYFHIPRENRQRTVITENVVSPDFEDIVEAQLGKPHKMSTICTLPEDGGYGVVRRGRCYHVGLFPEGGRWLAELQLVYGGLRLELRSEQVQQEDVWFERSSEDLRWEMVYHHVQLNGRVQKTAQSMTGQACRQCGSITMWGT